jgi:VanZ family protein
LDRARKQLLKTWITAGLWLGLIAAESSNLGSVADTSRLLYPILHFVIGLDPIRFVVWHAYIRKIGHFVGYFTLSLLLFRAWKATLAQSSLGAWAIQWSAISFLMTFLVASLDEWHQTYIPSRTGTLEDVLLDSFAGLTAQVLLFTLLYSRNRLSREKQLESASSAR